MLNRQHTLPLVVPASPAASLGRPIITGGRGAVVALAALCGLLSTACLIPSPPSGLPEKVDPSLLGSWMCDPTEGKNPKLVVEQDGERGYAVRFDMPYVRHIVPESSTYFRGTVISICSAQFAVLQVLEMTGVGAPRGSGRTSPEPQYLLARVSRKGADEIRLRVVADRLLLPAPPDFAPLQAAEVRAAIERNIEGDDLYESGPGLACRRARESAHAPEHAGGAARTTHGTSCPTAETTGTHDPSPPRPRPVLDAAGRLQCLESAAGKYHGRSRLQGTPPRHPTSTACVPGRSRSCAS